MGRKILINGIEYPCKKISKIVVNSEKAVLLRDKEMFVFNQGLIVLETNTGTVEKYYAGRKKSKFGVLLYDPGVNKEQRLFLSEESYNKNWKRVFVYLFDEDGAYLLFAERSVMNAIGVLYDSGYMESIPRISQCALNIASLINTSLVKEIMDMEVISADEVSLIEESR